VSEEATVPATRLSPEAGLSDWLGIFHDRMPFATRPKKSSPDLLGLSVRLCLDRNDASTSYFLLPLTENLPCYILAASVPKVGLIYLVGLNRLDWIGLYRDMSWIGLINC
jgi:hypothetical protein